MYVNSIEFSLFKRGLLSMLVVLGCASYGDDASRLQAVLDMYQGYRKEFAGTPEMSVKEFLTQPRGERVVIIDVREARERQVSIIPGAVPLATVEGNVNAYEDVTCLVYCTIGYRSGLATAKLRRQGLHAVNLKGGILAWTHAGQRVLQNDQETRRVHVYGRRWSLLPQGYEAVW